MNSQPDRELVEAVIAGNTDFFSVLVSRYMRSTVGIAIKIIRDKHLAEDIAQDAFVLAYKKLNSLKDANKFGPWLFQITRHQALQELRKGKVTKSLTEVSSENFSSQTKLDNETDELLELVEKLAEHERVVIMLKYFDGHSVSDIASITGQTIGTVTKKLTRARKRLFILIEENHS